MKKITNAFAIKNKDYGCFGCSPYNKNGLQLEFYKDEQSVWAEWEPRKEFDGWKGVVHGGIQATLIDETAEWYIFTQLYRSAVTMELNIRYKNPLASDKGKVKIIANLEVMKRNIAIMKIKVFDNSGKLCSEANGKFYVFSEEDSKNKYNFPDATEFE